MSLSALPFFRTGQKSRCPSCDAVVEKEEINLTEGVALCSTCGTLTRLRELVFRNCSIEDLLKNPPAGCSSQEQVGERIATVSTRSIGGFFMWVGVSLFWNGIVSVFAVIAIGGLWANLIGPLPNWFPAVENGHPQVNDHPMSLGETLFMCLFLTPFLLIGTGMIFSAAMSLWGKVEVVINQFDSYVTSGVGPFRLKRRFASDEVKSVSLVQALWQSSDDRNQRIEIDSNRLVRFGSNLTEHQLHWFKATLETWFKTAAK